MLSTKLMQPVSLHTHNSNIRVTYHSSSGNENRLKFFLRTYLWNSISTRNSNRLLTISHLMSYAVCTLSNSRKIRPNQLWNFKYFIMLFRHISVDVHCSHVLFINCRSSFRIFNCYGYEWMNLLSYYIEV